MKKFLSIFVVLMLLFTITLTTSLSVSAADDGYTWVSRDFTVESSLFVDATGADVAEAAFYPRTFWDGLAIGSPLPCTISIKEISVYTTKGQLVEKFNGKAINIVGVDASAVTTDETTGIVTVKKGTKVNERFFTWSNGVNKVKAGDYDFTLKINIKFSDIDEASFGDLNNIFGINIWSNELDPVGFQLQLTDGAPISLDEIKAGTEGAAPGTQAPAKTEAPTTTATTTTAPAAATTEAPATTAVTSTTTAPASDTTAPAVSTSPATSTQSTSGDSDGSSIGLIIGIIAAVVVIGGGVAAYFFFFKKKKSL